MATLIIPNINKSSQGYYDCAAVNDYGEEKKTINLLVEEVEQLPKNHTGK